MVQLILFDIDGTLVHTGGAGIKAFAKTFATEFNAFDGVEKINFAGRTDVNLVREFFGLHQIAATPENFRRFFERYVFWLDQIGGAEQWGRLSRGAPNLLMVCSLCPTRRCSACSPATSAWARKSNCAVMTFGTFLKPAHSPTTMKIAIKLPWPRTRAAAGCWAGHCAARKLSWSATRRMTSAAGGLSVRKYWPSPPVGPSWTN